MNVQWKIACTKKGVNYPVVPRSMDVATVDRLALEGLSSRRAVKISKSVDNTFKHAPYLSFPPDMTRMINELMSGAPALIV